jgi:hypothetical protein
MRIPERTIDLGHLTFDKAEPCEVLPSHGPLSEQDLLLFRDWECAAAPRGVHKFLVSGMAIEIHEGVPVLAFTDKVCHRTADRDLLLKKRQVRDCRVSVIVKPLDTTCPPTTDRADCTEALVGPVFRMSTVRQYYQFGIEGRRRLVLYRRNHDEWSVLAERPLTNPDGWLDLTVELCGDSIHCTSEAAGVDFMVTDTLYKSGRVGIRSLRQSLLKSITITQSESAAQREQVQENNRQSILHRATQSLPDAVPVASFPFEAEGLYPMFGDFATPGRHDILMPQADRLEAMTLDGSILWEFPEATTDLVISRDYTSEHGRLIYAMGGSIVRKKQVINGKPAWTNANATELLVIAGRTGQLLARAPLPISPSKASFFIELMKTTACLSGPSSLDIIVRDNRSDLPSGGGTTVWAYDRFLRPLWQVTQERDMAHYGHAYALAPFDVDGDGRDEILAGGILYSSEGKEIWRHDCGGDVAGWPNSGDHYDEVILGNFSGDATMDPLAGLAASSAGFYLVDALTGKTLAWHRIGHAQYIVAARMRPDLPGQQILVSNHHGSNGLTTLFSGRGEFLWSLQPTFYVMRPVTISWPGAEGELLWSYASPTDQSFVDGYGRCVRKLPRLVQAIGEWPRRQLNAEVSHLGTNPQPMLTFTAHGKLHIFGPG